MSFLNNETVGGQNMMALNIGEAHTYQDQALAVKGKGNIFKKRLTKEEKLRLKCKYCGESGHEIEECFKLHSVPDWYKRFKENREKYQANYAENNEDTIASLGGFD